MKAEWAGSADVKRHYTTTNIVNAERIVFNIEGNDHRPVVTVDCEKGIVWIKWVGTHKVYGRIIVPHFQSEVQHRQFQQRENGGNGRRA